MGKPVDVQDPRAKGFSVEEVQSQTDWAQMLCDLGAALNQPLYFSGKWTSYPLGVFSGLCTIVY